MSNDASVNFNILKHTIEGWNPQMLQFNFILVLITIFTHGDWIFSFSVLYFFNALEFFLVVVTQPGSAGTKADPSKAIVPFGNAYCLLDQNPMKAHLVDPALATLSIFVLGYSIIFLFFMEHLRHGYTSAFGHLNINHRLKMFRNILQRPFHNENIRYISAACVVLLLIIALPVCWVVVPLDKNATEFLWWNPCDTSLETSRLPIGALLYWVLALVSFQIMWVIIKNNPSSELHNHRKIAHFWWTIFLLQTWFSIMQCITTFDSMWLFLLTNLVVGTITFGVYIGQKFG